MKLIRTFFICCAAVAGVTTAIGGIVLFVGFGLFDTWIVYPPEVDGYRWWIPLSCLFLCWFFLYCARASQPTPPLLGYCHKCGYDLRATPDLCPECGTHSDVDEQSLRRPLPERLGLLGLGLGVGFALLEYVLLTIVAIVSIILGIDEIFDRTSAAIGALNAPSEWLARCWIDFSGVPDPLERILVLILTAFLQWGLIGWLGGLCIKAKNRAAGAIATHE